MSSAAINIQLFESCSPSWPRHWHEDVQVVASLAGFARHRLRASSRIIAPSDIIVVNPDVTHTTVAERGSSWRFLSLHLPLALFHRFREENRTGSSAPISFSTFDLGPQKIHRQLIDLHRAVADEAPPLFREACLQELIHSLWGLSREPLCLSKIARGKRTSLRLARSYLHAHFADENRQYLDYLGAMDSKDVEAYTQFLVEDCVLQMNNEEQLEAKQPLPEC